MNHPSTAVPYQTFNVMQPGTRPPTSPRTASPTADPVAAHHLALLARLPRASHVLFVGEASDKLLSTYRRTHKPESCDRIALGAGLSDAADGRDLFVFANGVDTQADAGRLLEVLAARCAPEAELFICDTHATQPIDKLFELLANSGWMPDLVPQHSATVETDKREQIRLIQATRQFAKDSTPRHEPAPACFSVVVASRSPFTRPPAAVTSPGLAEVQAHVAMAADATSAAHAFAMGLQLDQTQSEWILLCHESAYFPAGFGHRLNALLSDIPPADQEACLIGFIGIGVDEPSQSFAPAGFVIEQLHREDHPDCLTATSIDELALVISRRTAHQIDPGMGWDLWATDLCLAAICEHKVFPRIVRMPLLNRAEAKPGSSKLHASATRLLDKFPGFGPIPTLSGMIDAAFVERLSKPADTASSSSTQPAKIAPPAAIAATASAASANSSATETPLAANAAGMPECSICGTAVAHWSPHPQTAMRSEFMKLLDPVGSDLSVYQCPNCGCTDRDRHLWHYMRAIGLLQRLSSTQILHIAPEVHLEALIEALHPMAYVRGDLHPRRADHLPLDIESLPFDDGSFDLIICNHVLEHVASPARALGEFHRCLVPGGLLIAQTPYAPVLLKTMELNRPVSAGFAKLFFGQEDHVRLFGADIVDYFHQAGFSGELLEHSMVLGDLDAKAYGCNAREPFFAFSK